MTTTVQGCTRPARCHPFAVSGLEPALAAVGAQGGFAFDPIVAPSGARIAVCDDDQGAAFALQEAPSATL